MIHTLIQQSKKIAYFENNIKEIDNQISLKRDIIAKQDRILNRYKEVILKIKKMGENQYG